MSDDNSIRITCRRPTGECRCADGAVLGLILRKACITFPGNISCNVRVTGSRRRRASARSNSPTIGVRAKC